MTRKQQNLVVHEPKKRVDLTTYVENHEFQFDQVFDEKSSNEDVYLATTYPLLRHVFDGFNATVFAYVVIYIYSLQHSTKCFKATPSTDTNAIHQHVTGTVRPDRERHLRWQVRKRFKV